MTKYEQYLEDYQANNKVNMWNPEVVEDLMKEFNLSYMDAHKIRSDWFQKYEKPRLKRWF